MQRRDFLKEMGVVSGGAVALGLAPWLNSVRLYAGSGKVSASDKVRIGIIGVGSRGSKLLLHLQQIIDTEIVAVCDDYQPNFEKAMELTQNKAKGFKDYRQMLGMNDLDAVVVATPIFNHPIITNDALDAGKHVFCEKAMSNAVEDAKEMVLKSRETRKILQIGHQRMFDVKYLKALDMVKNGEFGPVTHIRANWYLNSSWRKKDIPHEYEKRLNWRMYKEQCLGLMSELACHVNQVANWFIGDIPEYVVGTGSIRHYNDGRTTYDNVNVMYQYPDGTNFTFNSGLSNWHYGLEEQIMGPLNTYELEKGKIYSQSPPPPPAIKQLVTDIEKNIFEAVPLGGASWLVNTGNTNKGELIVDQYPLPSATTLQLEAFVDSVKKGNGYPELLEQGYYGTIAAILGHYAMEEKQTKYFTDDMKI